MRYRITDTVDDGLEINYIRAEEQGLFDRVFRLGWRPVKTVAYRRDGVRYGATREEALAEVERFVEKLAGGGGRVKTTVLKEIR